MRPENWILKNATSKTIAAEAIELFHKRIDLYQSYNDEIRQDYIKRVKESVKWSEIFYNEKFELSDKAFLKYYLKY